LRWSTHDVNIGGWYGKVKPSPIRQPRNWGRGGKKKVGIEGKKGNHGQRWQEKRHNGGETFEKMKSGTLGKRKKKKWGGVIGKCLVKKQRYTELHTNRHGGEFS